MVKRLTSKGKMRVSDWKRDDENRGSLRVNKKKNFMAEGYENIENVVQNSMIWMGRKRKDIRKGLKMGYRKSSKANFSKEKISLKT